MRSLGIDYGKERIGLALSDESHTIANAIDPLQNKNDKDSIQRIVALAQDKDVETIVVGLPVSLAGGEEYQARIVKDFAFQLAERFGKSVEFVDERLSTSQARTMLGQHAKKVSIDSHSAQIILQTYLDKPKSKNK